MTDSDLDHQPGLNRARWRLGSAGHRNVGRRGAGQGETEKNRKITSRKHELLGRYRQSWVGD